MESAKYAQMTSERIKRSCKAPYGCSVNTTLWW